MNPFDQLGIPRGSAADIVRSAYRRLAKTTHPDHNPGDPSAASRFALLQEVYQAALRAGSDTQTSSQPDPSSTRKPPARHRTVYREVFLDVMQAISGRTVPMEGASGLCGPCSGTGRLACEHPVGCATCDGSGIISTQSKGYISIKLECHECLGTGTTMHVPCHHCGGFGVSSMAPCHVEIPANVRDGDTFRVEGAASIPEENVRGDIEFVVRIMDKRFRLDGNDIQATLWLDVWQAARGCVMPMKLPDGSPMRLTVPAGTAGGRKFTIKGKGMPPLDGEDGGDFVAAVSIRPLAISSPEIDVAMAALERAVTQARSGK
jgi:DnaJ-class molecular chaperone